MKPPQKIGWSPLWGSELCSCRFCLLTCGWMLLLQALLSNDLERQHDCFSFRYDSSQGMTNVVNNSFKYFHFLCLVLGERRFHVSIKGESLWSLYHTIHQEHGEFAEKRGFERTFQKKKAPTNICLGLQLTHEDWHKLLGYDGKAPPRSFFPTLLMELVTWGL